MGNVIKKAAIGATVGAALSVATQGILAWIGFGKAGVTALSLAAKAQTANVAAGSLFSVAQSYGATIFFLSLPVLATTAIIGGITVPIVAYLSKKKIYS